VNEAVSVFLVELVAALDALLEGLFKSLPILCANCVVHGMKMRLYECIQVFSELRPESGAYPEKSDDLVELVLRELPIERLGSVVENMIPFSNLLHQMCHPMLSLGKLFEA